MSRKTHAEHVAEIAAKNPNVEVLGEIINTRTKVLCRCKICSHEWSAQPANLKSKKGCPKCAQTKRVNAATNATRLTHKEQVAAINKVNPNIEVLGEIKGNGVKVPCRCKICGHTWDAVPNHLKQKHGCPKCSGRVVTHDEHMTAIVKANPNVEVLEKITNVDTKVLCRCKICLHEWYARPYSLKRRHGCPACKIAKIANAHRLTHTEQVEAINRDNPNVEILGKIIDSRTKVLCSCKICNNVWFARPDALKSGEGCPRCAIAGFLSHDVGKLYIMVDDLELPTMMKIGVSVKEEVRRRVVLNSARRAGVFIPALHVAKTWEGQTELMQRIESMMHENYAEWNIKFPTKFDGSTEFFYYTPETAEVFDIIEETYNEIVNANKAA